VIQGRAALAAVDLGGSDVTASSLEDFGAALTRKNYPIKRSLTDPRVLSGIGNAYSDEILHHAQLSPARLTQKMTREELARLHASCKVVLQKWIERLRAELGPDGFPEQVTAFHDAMTASPAPRAEPACCASPTPTTRRTTARCQTSGKLLADRSPSRLLKEDWPKTLSELEKRALVRGVTPSVELVSERHGCRSVDRIGGVVGADLSDDVVAPAVGAIGADGAVV